MRKFDFLLLLLCDRPFRDLDKKRYTHNFESLGFIRLNCEEWNKTEW